MTLGFILKNEYLTAAEYRQIPYSEDKHIVLEL